MEETRASCYLVCLATCSPMKKPITVKILVTVNDMAHFDACTLCFKTLRVGWPTADIHIYANGDQHWLEVWERLASTNWRIKEGFHREVKMLHHAEWIRREVSKDYPGPLVICDADTVFWESCEDWQFPEESLLAGYYVPRMWNDFARCVSVPRIHTSMMVFPDLEKLWRAICHAYPLANMRHGEYCPCDPFMPAVRFEDGRPIFWDSCANLFNMLFSLHSENGFDLVRHFEMPEKSCFDHLNSASFHEIMCERMEPVHKEGFIRAHRDWVKKPVPWLWPLVDEYYKQKNIEGWIKHPQL